MNNIHPLIFAALIYLLIPNSFANKFVFDLSSLKWHAINTNGKMVRSGFGSGGKSYCRDVKRILSHTRWKI